MLNDVRVLNDKGVWFTDLVTSSAYRATERAKFLIGRVPAVQVIDQTGRRVDLIGA